MEQKPSSCLYCGVDSNTVPLVKLEFKGQELRICPQHLPLLIHEPAKLVGILEGAESLKPYEG